MELKDYLTHTHHTSSRRARDRGAGRREGRREDQRDEKCFKSDSSFSSPNKTTVDIDLLVAVHEGGGLVTASDWPRREID